jgi:DNA-binding PadR family transcriptional regulator
MRHIAARTNTANSANSSVDASPPLSEAVLLILLSMAEEARHGYAILKDVEELSQGRVRLSTGTLYGALRRMLDDRWIQRFKEDDAPRDRTAYQLTPAGQDVLVNEVARMKLLTRVATLRLNRMAGARS